MNLATAEITSIAPKPIAVVFPEPVKRGRYDGLIGDMLAAFAGGDHFAAAQRMLDILTTVEGDSRGPNPGTSAEMTQAVNAVLTLFCRPDFVVPERLAGAFVWHNPTIANAMAAAGDNTTDAFVASLAGQRQEVFKSCVLISPRNYGDLRFGELLRNAPSLASTWFNLTFKTAFSGNVNSRCREKLMALAKGLTGEYRHVKDVQEPYFLCTYLGDMDAERNVKATINRAAQAVAPKIDNGPSARAVAVVSDLWMPGHSVHRTLKAYIEAIAADYRLILVSTIRKAENLDTSLFSETMKLDYDGETLDTRPLNGLGLDAVIYPDIGMTGSSIMLANTRIAPVQVMMTGHPVSTFGSEIDYFISGEAVETAEHQANYTETLVRLPGFGATHAKPTYEHRNTPKDFDGVLINCSWYGQKITRPFLELVNSAIAEAGGKVRLQIFAGGAATSRGGFGAFLRDIGEVITACEAIVYPHLEYGEYMSQMERADFAIDCYCFAGSNTVSDNLWLRKPVVALEGDRWFNRIGPAMLRAVGLGGLVATDEQQFRNVIIDMIRYGHVRDEFSATLAAADLDTCLYAPIGADAFREWLNMAVDAARHSRPA